MVYREDGGIEFPVDGDWTRAAQDHGVVMLSCGTIPLTSTGMDSIEEYVARPEHLFMGLLRLASPDHRSPTESDSIATDLTGLATAMPVTEEDMARKAQLTAPVQAFFRQRAITGQSYTTSDMLVELTVLQSGPPAGPAGPTWGRSAR